MSETLHLNDDEDNIADVNDYGSFEFTPTPWPPHVQGDPVMLDCAVWPLLIGAWAVALVIGAAVAVWRVGKGSGRGE